MCMAFRMRRPRSRCGCERWPNKIVLPLPTAALAKTGGFWMLLDTCYQEIMRGGSMRGERRHPAHERQEGAEREHASVSP